MLVVLIGVSTWLQLVDVTNLSGQMLTFYGIWHFGEVFSSRLIPVFAVQGRWQTACMASCGWAVFAEVNVVAHGGGGVMVWAGVCYGQQTQVQFIDSILTAQRYCNEILRPIVVSFIHDHQVKSNHFYCHITTAHVPWRVKLLRACSRQCRNNLHIDSTYLQTYTDDNAQYTHIYIYILSTHSVLFKTYLQLSTHSMYTFYIMYTYIHTIREGAADFT